MAVGIAEVRCRIEHAESQIQYLQTAIRTWVDNQHPVPNHQHDVDAGMHTLWISGVEQPPIGWGITVGDICHSLRAALDNTVYLLAIRNSGQPLPDNKLQFPIYSRPGVYPPNGGSALSGLSNVAILLIEGFQPFQYSDRPHPLEILAGINDIDKHRLVNVAQVFTEPGWEPPFTAIDRLTLDRMQRTLASDPINETAVRLFVTPPNARLKFNAEGDVTFDVRFGDRSSRVDTNQLVTIDHEVVRIIGDLMATIGESL